MLLLTDWLYNLKPKILELLNASVDVLIYNGDKDWSCNWRGAEAMTHKLEYAGKQEFNNQDYTQWMVDNEEVG